MQIRAQAGQPIRVPALDGEPVVVRVQGMQVAAEGVNGEAVAALPYPLHFGNRREIVGRAWKGKAEISVIVERSHGH